MAKLLVSDTNSAIKLAFLEDKFFQDDFLSIGTVKLWHGVVLKEVKGHLRNPEKESIYNQLNYLKDCDHYGEFEFDQYEFYSYQSREIADGIDAVSESNGLLGTSDEDQELLYIALTNNCHLVTNEYALADLCHATFNLEELKEEHGDKKIYRAEYLVLCALAEGKLSPVEVQALLDAWGEAGEYVMSIKRDDFTNKGFTVPTPKK